MNIVHSPQIFQDTCTQMRGLKKTISFIPTMGALHQGHIALIKKAKEQLHGFCTLSIFVNPKQFEDKKDLASYPTTIQKDLNICRKEGVDLVFTPQARSMYPAGFQSEVQVTKLSACLEGIHRPTHFTGVATIVTKLLILTGPCFLFVGKKDYQQAKMIERLIQDLHLPVSLSIVPTHRDKDGLAWSSRNRHLSAQEREKAKSIPEGLSQVVNAWNQGINHVNKLHQLFYQAIANKVDHIDYIQIIDPQTLFTLQGSIEKGIMMIAVKIGKTRLIDNIELGIDSPSVPSVKNDR